MTGSEYIALLTLATAMSFSPGPNNTLSAAMAANGGLRSAVPFVCAVPVGWGLLAGLCALGLGAMVLKVPALHWGIKILGTGYLLFMAYRLIRAKPVSPASPATTDTSIRLGFVQGVAMQFVNIKAWMLALAISAGWVVGRADMWERLIIVAPTMMAFAFTSNLSYAVMGAVLREWLGVGNRLVWFNRAMATILIATSIWMFTI